MFTCNNLTGWGSKANQGPTLIEVIQQAGLTTNLKLCLDAYDKDGGKWRDTSGNGHDFFLGTTASVEASDPTWTGDTFTFDGGDYFTYDTTNETWMNRLHKNNAIFSAVAFEYYVGSGFDSHFGTSGSSGAAIGLDWFRRSLTVRYGAGNALEISADTAIPENSIFMTGISLNEATGAGGGFLYLNGAYNQVSGSDTFTSTYTTPSTSDASYPMQIGALGNGSIKRASGDRQYCLAIWEGTAITKANMDTIWAAMRGRFNI